MITDEALSTAIRSLFRLNLGLSLNLFGLLEIRQLESGEFEVSSETHLNESLFCAVEPDLEVAIEHFLRIRSERQLGADYESEAYRASRAEGSKTVGHGG